MKIIRLAFAMMVVLCLFRCSKSDPDPGTHPVQTSFTVDKKSVSIPDGTSATVKITASSSTIWKVKDPGVSWLVVSSAGATGSGELTLTVKKATYREKREAVVTITTDDTSIEYSSRTINISITGAVPNTAPSSPANAVYPVSDAKDVPEVYMRLQWADAVDPEGDKITYAVEYSTDQKTWTKSTTQAESTSFTFYSKLAANTTYYWRVTAKDYFGAESAPSKVFSFSTPAQLNAWKNGEVRLFQNNGNGSKDAFTLIVTGDGFTSDDMANAGNWENTSLSAINGLFENAEPYKTYRSYLKVYRISAISSQSVISEHINGDQTGLCSKIVKTRFGTMFDNVTSSAWTGLFDNPSPSTGGSFDKVFNWVDSCLIAQNIKVEKNYAVLVLQNVAHYNGSVNYFWDNGKNRTMGFVCLSTGTRGTQTGFENVIVHEIGGHAIGHLADLYQTAPTATLSDDKKNGTIQYQSYGWYQNVDVSGDKTKCPWANILSSAEYPAYYSLVGYFEGARSVGKGIWRAESDATCMNDNRFYYDAASRYAIVKQLKQAAGETLSWAEFVNKDYDHGNAIVTKNANINSNIPPLPEPVIWR